MLARVSMVLSVHIKGLGGHSNRGSRRRPRRGTLPSSCVGADRKHDECMGRTIAKRLRRHLATRTSTLGHSLAVLGPPSSP